MWSVQTVTRFTLPGCAALHFVKLETSVRVFPVDMTVAGKCCFNANDYKAFKSELSRKENDDDVPWPDA